MNYTFQVLFKYLIDGKTDTPAGIPLQKKK